MNIDDIMSVDNIRGRIKNDESLVTKEGYRYLNGIVGVAIKLLLKNKEDDIKKFYELLNDGEGVIVCLDWFFIVSNFEISKNSDYNTPKKFKDVILTLAIQVFRDEYNYSVDIETYAERMEIKI